MPVLFILCLDVTWLVYGHFRVCAEHSSEFCQSALDWEVRGS